MLKNRAIEMGMKRLRRTASGPKGPTVREPSDLKSKSLVLAKKSKPSSAKVRSAGRPRMFCVKGSWRMKGLRPRSKRGRAMMPAMIQGFLETNWE